MATFTEKDKTTLFVGKDTAITTGDISTLNDGEIGIFNKAKTGRMLEATGGATAFTIAEGKGSGTPFVSDTINISDVTKVSVRTAQAAVEKVDYIGWNGTSGAISVINSNLYFVRLHIDQSITSSQGGGILVKHGQYKSDASATQEEITNGLYESLINNFSREAKSYINFERVNSKTITNPSGTGTLAVTNGSKIVKASTAIDDGSMAVGCYISILGVIYKIVAMDVPNETATLDFPYTGATNAAVADADVGFITEADAQGDAWGIKMTGKPLKFSVGKTNYKKANWKTTVQNFGTTTVTESAGAYPGSGTYEQAAELEFFYKGNDGEYFRKGAPDIFDRPIATVPGSTYHTVTIEVAETGGVTTRNKRSKTYVLLIPVGADYALENDGTNPVANDITDVLEVLLAGKPQHGNGATVVSVSGNTIDLS